MATDDYNNVVFPGATSVGLRNVGSYQASSKPYLSSSISVEADATVLKISFPNVTRFVTIKNIGPEGENEVDLRVGFSEVGVNNNNYLLLNNQDSFSADWKVTDIYLRTHTNSTTNATASVIAGLTGISTNELPHNWTGSTGVG